MSLETKKIRFAKSSMTTPLNDENDIESREKNNIIYVFE